MCANTRATVYFCLFPLYFVTFLIFSIRPKIAVAVSLICYGYGKIKYKQSSCHVFYVGSDYSVMYRNEQQFTATEKCPFYIFLTFLQISMKSKIIQLDPRKNVTQ